MNKEVMQQAMLEEIELVLTDPESKLSNGAQYALRYVYQQIQAITEAEKQEQDEPVAYINVQQRKLEWAKYTSWETPTVVTLPKIPLYTKPQPKQEQDEPVAWYDREIDCAYTNSELNGCEVNGLEPLYITPQTKEWVGLTEKDLKPICDEWRIIYGAWVDDFAKQIEAKLKEKNET